ncbi:hypothetical protein BH10CYA1_BH10CYA1_03660 [soil metagenome]
MVCIVASLPFIRGDRCYVKTDPRINTIGDITLREVLQRFLEIKPIRKDTQRNYHYSVNRHFNDWLDMPISSITKDMVGIASILDKTSFLITNSDTGTLQ